MATHIFSSGEIWATLGLIDPLPLMKDMPSDAVIHFSSTRSHADRWYRPDLTPILLTDVPKEYRTMLLLLI